MQVITLLDAQFDQACQTLAQVSQAGKYSAIVGIRTGGAFVAKRMIESAGLESPIFSVSCQRSTTQSKQSARGLLRLLPLWLKNTLRVLEHRLREKRLSNAQTGETRTVRLDSDLTQFLQNKSKPQVLLVDDAVDTGSSLVAVIQALKDLNPGVEIATAAIVQTFKTPLTKPDFVLYQGVLIRFPWSMDA